MRVLYVMLIAACSSQDTVAQLDEEETAAAEDSMESPETIGDTTVTDAPPEASPEASTDTASPGDTASPPVDTGTADIGTTFPCGSEMCGSSLQFCRRATSPGICPPADSGICPAGCPGCPMLGLRCETLPMKCWAKPSCSCILVEICGSAAAGDCMERDGGFVAGCRGV